MKSLESSSSTNSCSDDKNINNDDVIKNNNEQQDNNYFLNISSLTKSKNSNCLTESSSSYNNIEFQNIFIENEKLKQIPKLCTIQKQFLYDSNDTLNSNFSKLSVNTSNNKIGKNIGIPINQEDSSKFAFEWYYKHIYTNDDTVLLLHSHRMNCIIEEIEVILDPARNPLKHKLAESYISLKNELEKFTKFCVLQNIQHRLLAVPRFGKTCAGLEIVQLFSSNFVDMIIVGYKFDENKNRTFNQSTAAIVMRNSTIPVTLIPLSDSKICLIE